MNWKTLMLCGVCAIALAAETGAELYQKALVKERGAGNLEEAIQIYQRVAREFPGDRALAAKALVQAARCYEKLGQDKAVKIYEQVARDFGDQREQVMMARGRLAAITGGTKPKTGSGMVARQILVPPFVRAESDGKHMFYVDNAAGGLMVADMDGKRAHLAIPGDDSGINGFSISADGKYVAWNHEDSSKESFYVAGIDGSGLRELFRKPLRGVQPVGSWSSDNRHILASIVEPDETNSLISISVADGAVRKLANTGRLRPVPARFSPDRKYVAYGSAKGGPVQSEEHIYIVASDGSSRGILVDHPAGDRLLDWTPDGRHIVFLSNRTGKTDMYMLAVREGKPDGLPMPIKQGVGEISFGNFTREGTLIYKIGESSRSEVFLVNLDPASGVVTDRRPISERLTDNHFPAAWSPDGRMLAYGVVRGGRDSDSHYIAIRMLDTGQEREFPIQGPGSINLGWAPDSSSVFEVVRGRETAGLRSVSVSTGAVKQVATFPNGRRINSLSPSHDGKALLIGFGDSKPLPARAGIISLDMTTGEQTELMSKDAASELTISPDGRRAAALHRSSGKLTVSVKAIDGGEWAPVATLEKPVFDLQWAPDGSSLRLVSEEPTALVLEIPAGGGKAEKIADFRGLKHIHDLRAQPGGRQATFHTLVSRTELWLLENFLPKELATR